MDKSRALPLACVAALIGLVAIGLRYREYAAAQERKARLTDSIQNAIREAEELEAEGNYREALQTIEKAQGLVAGVESPELAAKWETTRRRLKPLHDRQVAEEQEAARKMKGAQERLVSQMRQVLDELNVEKTRVLVQDSGEAQFQYASGKIMHQAKALNVVLRIRNDTDKTLSLVSFDLEGTVFRAPTPGVKRAISDGGPKQEDRLSVKDKMVWLRLKPGETHELPLEIPIRTRGPYVGTGKTFYNAYRLVATTKQARAVPLGKEQAYRFLALHRQYTTLQGPELDAELKGYLEIFRQVK